MALKLKRGAHVRSTQFEGVALWYLGECQTHGGCAKVRMVGDDMDHHVLEVSLTKLKRDQFCGSCGQIGCAHGA